MILKLIQIIIPIIMALLGVLQTVIYFRVRKYFYMFPVVAAEITYSRLLNQLGPNGEELLEAIIYFKYSIRGESFESNTPVLRGYELFPSYEFENGLVKKYRVGDIVNARVHPIANEIAFLEVAPLSKLSVILIPSLIVGAILVGVAYYYGLFHAIYDYFSAIYSEYLFQLELRELENA